MEDRQDSVRVPERGVLEQKPVPRVIQKLIEIRDLLTTNDMSGKQNKKSFRGLESDRPRSPNIIKICMDNTEYIPDMFVGSGTPTAAPLPHSGAS